MSVGEGPAQEGEIQRTKHAIAQRNSRLQENPKAQGPRRRNGRCRSCFTRWRPLVVLIGLIQKYDFLRALGSFALALISSCLRILGSLWFIEFIALILDPARLQHEITLARRVIGPGRVFAGKHEPT